MSELKIIAKDLRIRLTGAMRKQDIIEHLMCMARIGAVQEDESADSDDVCAISYLTDETKQDIRELPSFTSVTNWTKNLAGILMEFTFMNLLIYLVYGREKTFDMQSMKAFRSLKVYKFFDGYVRNVWVCECPRTSSLSLRVLYLRAYVYHSLTCDSPLEVYVSINGNNRDVYSGKCSCVSG